MKQSVCYSADLRYLTVIIIVVSFLWFTPNRQHRNCLKNTKCIRSN